MKKLVIIALVLFMMTGCGSATDNNANNNSNTGTYNGIETSLSRKYLSKGYIVNIYRSSTPLGDDAENYGKAYITMTFHVIAEHTSIVDYQATREHIKKKTVSNIRIIKTPKMGMAEEIYADYGSGGTGTLLAGTNNKFEKNYDTPSFSQDQTSIAVKLNRVALFDSSKYGWDEQPSTSQIYSDLGITTDQVRLTLGFRIELTTVDNKILYKDYEIELPPQGFDIGGSEFQMRFMTDDTTQMSAFLEKE